MILRAAYVVDLQHFLMDAAKRFIVERGGRTSDAADLLTQAAALDYVLLLSSQAAEPFDGAPAVAEVVRDALARAASEAVAFAHRACAFPDDMFADFAGRDTAAGLFAALDGLRAEGALAGDDLAFRAMAARHDVLERAAALRARRDRTS